MTIITQFWSSLTYLCVGKNSVESICPIVFHTINHVFVTLFVDLIDLISFKGLFILILLDAHAKNYWNVWCMDFIDPEINNVSIESTSNKKCDINILLYAVYILYKYLLLFGQFYFILQRIQRYCLSIIFLFVN